jgi:hypothetical protein
MRKTRPKYFLPNGDRAAGGEYIIVVRPVFEGTGADTRVRSRPVIQVWFHRGEGMWDRIWPPDDFAEERP